MQRAVVDGLRAQRAATLAQLEAVGDDAWLEPCLPPWRVRDVLAHLVAVDEAILSGRVLLALRRHDRAGFERWNDQTVVRLAETGVAELLTRLRRRGEQVATRIARLPVPLDRLHLRTGMGRLTWRALACRRVLDEWVHGTDIARVTGVAAPLSAPVPTVLAAGALAPLPATSLPRIERPVGVLRLVVATGAGDDPGTALDWGVDLARRQYGRRVTRTPDATVHLHATTLALLTEGRLSWRTALAGSLHVDGDEELAASVLDALERA